MRFLKGFLPNLTIALNIAMMVVVYLDRRNPMMGFLIGAPFMTLAACCGICSIATCVVLYAAWRKPKKRSTPKTEQIDKNIADNTCNP